MDSLKPSQAIRSGSTSTGNNSNNSNIHPDHPASRSGANRGSGQRDKIPKASVSNRDPADKGTLSKNYLGPNSGKGKGEKNESTPFATNNTSKKDDDNNNKNSSSQRRRRGKHIAANKNGNKGKRQQNINGAARGEESNDAKVNQQEAPQNQKLVDSKTGGNTKKNKANNNRKRRQNNRKRFPWRKFIPPGSMDPITLENLVSLPYPPFALRASPPYLPVPTWPPEEGNKDAGEDEEVNDKNKEQEKKERERRLLQEQWGNVISPVEDDNDKKEVPSDTEAPSNPNHVNLFDGRALAYYLVSQLQFIDPLNRRDLEREELVHLDRYLVRNGFTDLNVVEAYDTKGVSLSTAGAAAATATGRMEILQQEARVLLNALFGGRNSLPAAGNNSDNSYPLQQQYSNYQAAQQQQHQSTQLRNISSTRTNGNGRAFSFGEETGVYGDEDGGMVVIDDDLNPSLRGGRGLRPYRACPTTSTPARDNTMTLWSSNRVTRQLGSQPDPDRVLQEDNFPSLSETAATAVTSPNQSASPWHGQVGRNLSAPAPAASKKPAKKPLPAVGTLTVIGKAVKKTSPEELKRQQEAREEARRKAALSNLTFGSNPASWDMHSKTAASLEYGTIAPTEGQLERNSVFADALGIATAPPPAASRLRGWARPTAGNPQKWTAYPDALILTARENMGALLKLEKKWKAWLEDDKAASLPLNKMDRDMRKFVHDYGSFYKMKTESFDPEPRRYIHCVKLLDTSAPYPLLSDAAKHWRGPTGMAAYPEHASQQTAGQDTRGREAPLARNNPRAASLTTERPKLEL